MPSLQRELNRLVQRKLRELARRRTLKPLRAGLAQPAEVRASSRPARQSP